MSKSRVEVLASRRLVRAHIDADPVEITPIRREKVAAPGGGWRWADGTPDVLPIRGALIPAKRRLSDFEVNTEMGDVVKYPFIFLTLTPAILLRGDTFTISNENYEVKSVHTDEGICLTAQIDYLGGELNGRDNP